MKKQSIIAWALLLAIPATAQQTNEFQRPPDGDHREFRIKRDRQDRPRRDKKTEAERKERKYQFMDKALSEIGLSEEDRAQIHALQKAHRNKMKHTSARVSAARQQLSALQKAGASEAEFDAAIEEITTAQAEQLKILVRTRMEMEKLLGKEKYQKFMETARMQFRQHGRHGGSGMPPRPDPRPIPTRKYYGEKYPPLPHSPGDPTPPPAEG